MEIKIVEERENPLLSRTRVKFEIYQDGKAVPSRAKVAEELATALKKDKDLIVIRNINADFGSSNVDGEAVVYSSKKSLERIEAKHSLKKHGSAKKSEEKPKEAPAQVAEKQPEEQKEEKPEE